MASVTIRDLPDATKEALRVQAAQNGLALESYLRHVLQEVSEASAHKQKDILDLATEYFGKENGVDLILPPRHSSRETVDFSE